MEKRVNKMLPLSRIYEDRQLYDLCRKYKFYYGQYHEFKKIEGKYWNKHLRVALKDCEENLQKTLLEIVYYIFNVAGVFKDFEMECNVPTMRRWDKDYVVKINGFNFYKLLQLLISEHSHTVLKNAGCYE